MEPQYITQVRPLHPSSHMSIYNSPIVSAASSNLTSGSSLNLMNGSATGSTMAHDLNSVNVLTTLHATTSNPTLTTHPSAHLLPVATLNGIKIHQVDSASSLSKNDFGPTNTIQDRQVFNVTFFNTLPAMAQSHPQMLASRVIGADTLSTNQSSNLTGDSQSPSSGSSCSTTKMVDCSQTSGKSETHSDDNKNDLSNNYATTDDDGGYRCLICNRKFTQRGNLKTHARTHLGPTERPYDCKTCGKRFTQKGNRDIHIKIHTGTKDHTCPHCDRGFTQRGNLKTHIRSIHTGEKPFSCDICAKKFSQKANMLTHFRTHDKSTRFSCNICNKTFSQKGNLRTHQHRHFQERGQNKA